MMMISYTPDDTAWRVHMHLADADAQSARAHCHTDSLPADATAGEKMLDRLDYGPYTIVVDVDGVVMEVVLVEDIDIDDACYQK